jgi:hypothetical protein
MMGQAGLLTRLLVWALFMTCLRNVLKSKRLGWSWNRNGASNRRDRIGVAISLIGNLTVA